MDRFGVRENAVEIEKDGFKLGHGGEFPAYQRKGARFHGSAGFVVSQKLNTMPSEEDLQAEIERLRAENESLKRPRGQTSLRVSEKGALSVYGLGRFPVTLYREQWEKLLSMADEIRQFIQDNDVKLKRKEQ